MWFKLPWVAVVAYRGNGGASIAGDVYEVLRI